MISKRVWWSMMGFLKGCRYRSRSVRRIGITLFRRGSPSRGLYARDGFSMLRCISDRSLGGHSLGLGIRSGDRRIY